MKLTIEYKAEVISALQSVLQADLETARRQQQEIADSATHEEARAENDKDTRGLEQSYLARGLAQRLAELGEQNARFQKYRLGETQSRAVAVPGALLAVRDEADARSIYFLTDGSGLIKTKVGQDIVRCVSTETPVGKALLGKSVGDVAEVRLQGRVRELEIEDLI